MPPSPGFRLRPGRAQRHSRPSSPICKDMGARKSIFWLAAIPPVLCGTPCSAPPRGLRRPCSGRLSVAAKGARTGPGGRSDRARRKAGEHVPAWGARRLHHGELSGVSSQLAFDGRRILVYPQHRTASWPQLESGHAASVAAHVRATQRNDGPGCGRIRDGDTPGEIASPDGTGPVHDAHPGAQGKLC